MDEPKLKKYMVYEGEHIIARDMTSDVTMMFVEAYMNKHFREHVGLTIKEEPRCEVAEVKTPKCPSCLYFDHDEHGPKCKLHKEYIPMSVVESGCNEYF